MTSIYILVSIILNMVRKTTQVDSSNAGPMLRQNLVWAVVTAKAHPHLRNTVVCPDSPADRARLRYVQTHHVEGKPA